MTLLTLTFLLLGLLIASAWGDAPSISFAQPVSVSASLGKAIRISCTLSGGSMATYTISWLQQQLPNPPKYLLHYKDESNQMRKEGVSDRFTASKDAAVNACYLTISGVQAADEATYYCLASTGPEYLFGGGTQLTVTGRPTVSPSVQVFAPSREEVGGQNPYTVVCLVSEFYPPGFTLQWKDDKNQVIPSGAETTKATKQGDKYLASSYLRLSAPEYEKHSTFTCEVTHESKTIAKTVSKFGSC